ncbi:MAG: tetratricopeptide repeat protein [Thermodesulfobacteriota bacterium]|nr:tetratricopeptide repeat protein [Thermodesulfobacteriota bacterium]
MGLTEDQVTSREKYNLALTKAKERRYQEAHQLLEESIALDPTLADPHNLMGKIYLQIGQTSKAKQSWQRALQLDPSNMTAKTCLDALEKNRFPWWNISIVTIGVVLILVQVITIASLNRKVNLQTEVVKNEVQYGITLIQNDMSKRLRSLSSSIREVRKFIEEKQTVVLQEEKVDVEEKAPSVAQESVEDRYRKAVYLCMDGRYKESRKLLMMLPAQEIREDLRDNLLFWMGLCFYREGKYHEALNEFQKLLELYPKGNKAPEARKWKAFCIREIRKISELRKPERKEGTTD